VIGERATIAEEIPERSPACDAQRTRWPPGQKKHSFPVPPCPVIPFGIRRPPNSDVARDRDIPDRLHGIDSSLANSRRKQEEEGKKIDGDAGSGGFMLNGLDSGMRFLDELPSPRVSPLSGPTSRAPIRSSSSRNGIRGRSKGNRVPLDRIGVALIASSKSGLIDEFRRHVARK